MNTNWTLSKTSYMKGRRCTKALFLHKHKAELGRRPGSIQKSKDKKAQSLESKYRKMYFPEGINMLEKCGRNFKDNVKQTMELLASSEEIVLFEAALVFDSVFVLVDVIHKKENGEIDVYEIKNTMKFKPAYVWDLSLQFYVARGLFKSDLGMMRLVYNSKHDHFKIKEMNTLCERYMERVENELKNCFEVLEAEKEPVVKMGIQCKEPYPCPYVEYCKAK